MTDSLNKYDRISNFMKGTVGLGEIKDALLRFVALNEFQQKTKGQHKISNPNLNMCFRGNAGTGKTMVAFKIAELYSELGFLNGSHENPLKMTSVNGASLLINGSSKKMHDIVVATTPGIILIDEAYAITESASTIGNEIIAALLTEMENHTDDLAIILAGYTQKMYKFMNFNPGLRSRIGVNITFPDYTALESYSIMQQDFADSGFRVTKGAEDSIMSVLFTAVRRPDFGNARFAKQFVQEILFEHALQTRDTTDPIALSTIEQKDVTEKILELLKLTGTGLI